MAVKSKSCWGSFCRGIVRTAAALVVLSATARAQAYLSFSGLTAKPDSTTVAGCVTLAERQWSQVFDRRGKAKQEIQKADYDTAEMQVRVTAKGCAARFNINSVPSAELLPLAMLHILADDQKAALEAVERLAKVGPADSDRAAALKYGVSVIFRSVGIMKPKMPKATADDLAMAEQFAQRLDALGVVAAAERLNVHVTLRRQYDSTRAAEREAHTVKAFAAIKEIAGETKKKAAYAIASFYAEVAQAQMTKGDTVAAEVTIAEGLATLADHGTAVTALRRMQLFGKPGPTMVATHWLNAPAGTEIVPKGKVYLLMLTATW